jgi:hypothetical protein
MPILTVRESACRFARQQSIVHAVSAILLLPWCNLIVQAQSPTAGPSATKTLPIIARPGLFAPLTEPPCSYCSTQHRKGLVRDDDRVVAWIRGAHNGGAIPVRHFLAAPRVINDTYGLFFYDPDGGYIAAYKKDYGYTFQGWRGGVMVVQGRDGTLWSALSGTAIAGPKQGERLERIPSLVTEWRHWLMLHPESTAYDLYDGKKYPLAELPREMSAEAKAALPAADPRLPPLAEVLGVEVSGQKRAYPLDPNEERQCFVDEVAGVPIAVFWYAPTRSAVAFSRRLDDRTLTLYADAISPETAPFKDKQTGTRWTLAGRGVDGPLRGKELTWIPSLQCRWFAWSAEHPDTTLYDAPK